MSKTIEIGDTSYTLPFCAVKWFVEDSTEQFFVDAETDADANYITAALNDYRPWRYPSRGELPKGDNYWVEISFAEYDDIALSYVDHLLWKDGKFCEEDGTPRLDVYAWRELPAPAPVIETEDGR